jgi:DNA-binding NtrC family response regulator
LRNTIERAVINARGPVLQLVDKLDLPANGLMTSCEKSLEDLEREIIIQRLEAANWRISGLNGAAQSLGLHPNTLRTRMLKPNIRRESASESRSSVQHFGIISLSVAVFREFLAIP